MKDITGGIQKFIFFLFSAVVICYTASLTFMLAARLVPNSIFLQAMTIVLFDIGALVWFNTFIHSAKGTFQWVIAAIAFTVSIVGVVIMAAGELLLGQKLVTIANPAQLGWIIVATVIIAALAHVISIYAFLFLHPKVFNKIEMAKVVADKVRQANEDARLKLQKETAEMRDMICDAVFMEAYQVLEEECGAHRRSKGRGRGSMLPMPSTSYRDIPMINPMPMTAAHAQPSVTPRPIHFNTPGNTKRNGKKPSLASILGVGSTGHKNVTSTPPPVIVTPNPTHPPSSSNP